MNKTILLSLSLISFSCIIAKTAEEIEYEIFHKVLQKNTIQHDEFEREIVKKHLETAEHRSAAIKTYITTKHFCSAKDGCLNLENAILPLKIQLLDEYKTANFMKNMITLGHTVFALFILISKGYKNREAQIAAGTLGAMALGCYYTKHNLKPLIASYDNSLYTSTLLQLQIDAEKPSYLQH